MFNRVIVPLDGSPLALSALPYALALADIASAPICLLHVVPPLATTLDCNAQYDASLEASALMRANETLVPLAHALHAGGRRVDTQALLGDPPTEILRYADRGEQDLVVMATHGRGGVLHWAFGSVARKVLTTADCPLLIVRPMRAPEHPATPATVRSILVPLDGSTRAEAILPLVPQCAKGGDARVTLIRVVPPLPSMYVLSPYATPTEVAYLDESVRAAENDAKAQLDLRARELTALGIPTSFLVSLGNVADTLLETVAGGKYDLVAMTTHGHTGAQRWLLGSVAERLVEGTHTPILLLRTADAT